MNQKDNDYYMRIAMRKYGGSFVKELAELLERADPHNYARLEKAFPEYFLQYRDMANGLASGIVSEGTN